MKLTILLLNNPFYEASASANRWLTLIEGLNQLGVKIRILVLGYYQSLKEKEIFENQYNNFGIEIKYLNNIVIDGIWKRRYYNYIGKYFQSIKTGKKVKEEIIDFDGILWTENDLSIWKIISTISKKSFKVITEMSEFLDIHLNNKGNFLQTKSANLKKSYFENTYIYELDGLILMTKTLMEHYTGFADHPSLLHLPMTVDLDRFKTQKPSPIEFKKPYISFVGAMNNIKDGVNILIESFYRIATDYPKINLYLVGPRDYDTNEHLARIKELKMKDRIIWVGEYPRESIPEIICNAKLLVLPRPDSHQARGGFPTKLGEYLASGRPVCATKVGEIPDYLTDNESVYFAEPGSIQSFTEAMTKALNDSIKADEIGSQGKNVAISKFNKKKQSKILYNFLKQL